MPALKDENAEKQAQEIAKVLHQDGDTKRASDMLRPIVKDLMLWEASALKHRILEIEKVLKFSQGRPL